MTAERLKIGQPRFLTLVEILDAHETAIARHGGAAGVREQGSLESALAMPEQSFSGEFAHAFPFEMAAAYAFHIAKNHPFVDGNKRTAFIAATLFLWMNGWRLESSEADAERAVLDLVTNKIDKAGFAGWLHEHSVARPSLELRDLFCHAGHPDQFLDSIRSLWISKADNKTRFAENYEALRLVFPAAYSLLPSTDATPSQAAFAAGALNTLLVLYRLAEDMGYEW